MQTGECFRQSPIPQPSHQHRHIRTLPAAIGMELVKHYEFQTFCVTDDLLIERILTRHQQLKHHEIRQKDIWRISCNGLALFAALLSCVSCEGWTPRLWEPRFADKLLQLFHLAVGERVHWVNHDRSCPFSPRSRGSRAQSGVDDRNEEAERLSRTCAGRYNEALPLPRLCHGLRLMLVELNLLAVYSEDVLDIRTKVAIPDKFGDCRS
jgi:hypothetical protein